MEFTRIVDWAVVTAYEKEVWNLFYEGDNCGTRSQS